MFRTQCKGILKMLSEKRILPASNNILIERRRLQISIKLMGAIFIIKVYLLNVNTFTHQLQ